MPRSTSPSAMPTANSPLPVSSAMAVVMVRVCHLMLPPTIMDMPTSETMRPKAVTPAPRRWKRTSHNVAVSTCHPSAPSVSSVWRNLPSACSTARAVSAMTMGSPRRARPTAMPGMVKSISRSASGPRRESRRYTRRPMTTVGKHSMVSTTSRATRLPGNEKNPSAKPQGIPTHNATTMASAEEESVAHTAENVSGSPASRRRKATAKPSRI